MLFIFPNKIVIYFVTLFSTNKDRDGYAERERPSALHKRSLPYNDKSCYIQVLRMFRFDDPGWKINALSCQKIFSNINSSIFSCGFNWNIFYWVVILVIGITS